MPYKHDWIDKSQPFTLGVHITCPSCNGIGNMIVDYPVEAFDLYPDRGVVFMCPSKKPGIPPMFLDQFKGKEYTCVHCGVSHNIITKLEASIEIVRKPSEY